jgi:hypothetical protein
LESTSSVLVGASASFSSILSSVSSSQQQISASLLQVSASYIALSGSYNTFSGSASTRVTQIETVYATTGSNSFRATQSITGSLTVTGQIIAQTINVQQVTSSIIYSSGSNNFGCDLNSRQTFTGSVLITGSLTIAGASSATSYSGATIYGSTAVCSPVGKFTSCIDAGSGTFSGCVGIGTTTPCNLLSVRGNADFGSTGYAYSGQAQYGGLTFPRGQIMWSNTNAQNQLYIVGNAYTNASGIFAYRNSCQPATAIGLDNGGMAFLTAGNGTADAAISWTSAIGIFNSGITCFYCQVCTPFVVTKGMDVGNGGASNPTDACVGYGIFGYSGIGLGITAGATGANQGMGFFLCGAEKGRWISNGNLGIGTVCPGGRLQIKASAAAGGTDALYIENSSSTGLLQVRDDGLLYMKGSVGIGTTSPLSTLVVNVNCNGGRGGEISITNIAGGSIGSEAALNFGFGGSSYNLDNGNAQMKAVYTGANEATDIVFSSWNGASWGERMRILNNSALMIGVSSGFPSVNYKLYVNGYGGVWADASNGGDAAFVARGTTGFYFYGMDNSSVNKFNVANSGQISSTSTSISAISDIRHKENIAHLETGLSEILALQPRRFDWKEGKGTGRKNVAGFVAQEMENIFPDLVDEWREQMGATETFKSIRMSDMIPTLVKAIQEQQCTICSQASMINTLKTCLGIN